VDDIAEFVSKNEKATEDNIRHVPKLVNSRKQSDILEIFTGQGAVARYGPRVDQDISCIPPNH
jgi:hypothetical protein